FVIDLGGAGSLFASRAPRGEGRPLTGTAKGIKLLQWTLELLILLLLRSDRLNGWDIMQQLHIPATMTDGGRRGMDREEARAILNAHLATFRRRSYADLIGLMGDIHVVEMFGPSGEEYQIEVEVIWESLREKTNLLVLGLIDNGRFLSALMPVNDSFIVG